MKAIAIDAVLITGDQTVKAGMKKLGEAATKVIFVVDSTRHLVGSLSDGDVRRWILSGGSLDERVDAACFRGTLTASEDFDLPSVVAEARHRRIAYVPVVKPDRSLVDVIGLEPSAETPSVMASQALTAPVVIMAGGKGTRMAPFTNVFPKPLLPIGDRTMLEVIMERFRRFGARNFYLTINYRGEMIRAYLEGIQKDFTVTYLKEEEFRGTAGSLSLLPRLDGGPIIVTNCDVLVRAQYPEVIDFHRSNRAALTVLSSIRHYKLPYGVVEFTNGGRIDRIREKPEHSFAANTGMYILDPRCISFIPPSGHYDMTDLIADLLKKGEGVFTYPVGERDYLDVGQWEEYRSAVEQVESFL